jgi:hypothetical protein
LTHQLREEDDAVACIVAAVLAAGARGGFLALTPTLAADAALP